MHSFSKNVLTYLIYETEIKFSTHGFNRRSRSSLTSTEKGCNISLFLIFFLNLHLKVYRIRTNPWSNYQLLGSRIIYENGTWLSNTQKSVTWNKMFARPNTQESLDVLFKSFWQNILNRLVLSTKYQVFRERWIPYTTVMRAVSKKYRIRTRGRLLQTWK